MSLCVSIPKRRWVAMKRKWRMFVALSCIVALLVTGPGLSVSASESQDAEIAAEAIRRQRF